MAPIQLRDVIQLVYEERLDTAEFIQLAIDNKIGLIDALSAALLKIGSEFALASAEYYKQKASGKESNFYELTFRYKSLEQRYDTLKHVISALQSTLKAEQTR